MFSALLFVGTAFSVNAQVQPPDLDASLRFIETGNRYGNSVQFEAGLPNGKLFLQPDRFTYNFLDTGKSGKHNHTHSKDQKATDAAIKGHAYTVTFSGAATQAIIPAMQAPGLYNYYIGNDKSKWISGAKAYHSLTYKNLYTGIDMQLLEQNGRLKYEFLIAPGTNPATIKMKYEGADKIAIRNGNLIITTSVITVTETKPYSYQVINGKNKEITSRFRLNGNEVWFDFPDGYDATLPLVIDPELVYSTFSGSAADNWGFTAAYDSSGNIYSGGAVFGAGFPATTGAYDLTFNGGYCDIGILKFDPTQTGANSLLYATYLGGSGSEAPHSLVVNSNNELLIYGTTGSADFPVTSQAYDASFAGGPSVTSPLQYGLAPSHPNGVDMIISKLNGTGGTLLASTFVGGSGNDGILLDGNPLVKNYGDHFRGDIITDENNNVYVTASTSSVNFQVLSGFQPGHAGGGSDAVVLKLSPDLDNLIWSTYLGGSGQDAAYSIQLDSINNVIVCGGTTSSNFPASAGSHSPFYSQEVDGFVARIAANGTVLQRATYLGTTFYDQAYFVQLDDAGNVYVFGQTLGIYPVTPGVFSVPNSKQFIHKLDYSLTNTIFSTVFGSVEPQINISPTAFMVNRCNTVFAAGWGGATNMGYAGGNTFDMPVTPDATQSTTDGSDFYIIALSNEGTTLMLGTYLGGAGVNEHVDGGTSRFDKNSDDGVMYQAVCAGCGGSSNFPTTPNAWSNVNGTVGTATPNCNNAVFKYRIAELDGSFIPSEIPNGPRDTTACVPAVFHFRKLGDSGVSFLWTFGDGTTSTLPGPLSHSYPQPGIYPVSLTITDSSTCAISLILHDTLYVSEPTGIAGPDTVMCMPGQLPLFASGGVSYSWTASPTLSATNIPDPIASPTAPTTYTVTITNEAGCEKTETATIGEMPPVSITAMTSICPGDSTQLTATPGYDSYTWTPATGLSATDIYNPFASPSVTTTYTVEVPAIAGCPDKAYVTVTVFPLPDLVVPPADTICMGGSVLLPASAAPGYSFLWTPAAGLSSTTSSSPIASPGATTLYTVTASSPPGCSQTDTVRVHVIPVISVNSLPPLCIGQSADLTATPGLPSYSWTPATGLNATNIFNPVATPTVTTTYTVYTTGVPGCPDSAMVTVEVLDLPDLTVSGPATICAGDSVQLTATATPGYDFAWSPATGLSATDIANPVATPTTTTTYNVTVTNQASCPQTASVTVQVLPSLSVNSPPAICEGQSSQLQATPGLTTYIWSPASGLSDTTISNPVATPQVTTTYTVFATGIQGCPDSAFVTVTVLPQLNLSVTAPPGPVCLGNSVQLQASATPGAAFAWTPATGLSATDISNPVAMPAATTVYTVTATSPDGCGQTDTVTVVVVPPLTTSAQSSICQGQSIEITATPGMPSYNWTPATGLSSTTIHNPIASPDTTTTYTVQITGAGNCPNTASITINVYPQANLNMPAGVTICSGSSVPLQATANPGFSFTWTPSIGLNTTDTSSVIASPPITTLYTVTASANGCSATDTVRITVKPSPTISAGPDAGLCIGDSIQIGSQGQPGVSYLWTPATGLSDATIANPIATPASGITYTVRATNAAGCEATDTVTIYVNAPPVVQMPGNSTICQGSSISLPVTDNPQFTYLWSPAGSLNNNTIASPLASPGTTTTYTLQTSVQGCIATQMVTVTVIPGMVAVASPNVQICPGQPTLLSASSYPGVNYSWWPASGLSGTDSAIVQASPGVTTTYYVQVTSSDGCSATDSVKVSVVPPPVISVIPAEAEGLDPLEVTFTNTSTGATSYFWNFGNNTSSVHTSPVVTYAPGLFYVELTSTYGPGCTRTDTVSVVRVNPPMVPNIITPNGDGKNDVFEALLTNGILQLRIYNRWGKMIYESLDYKQDWGAEGVPDGVYYYELNTPEGRSWKGWLEIMR